MSDQTPYDCRANHKAAFDDISPVLLEDHLRKTGSKLAKQVKERGVEEILEDMQLLVGPPELRYIQNVAIMMSCEPVTIEIEPDCINIMNFPGIDWSISEKTIAEGKRFVSRHYRNRRLGEFLKELDLSEGHSSGIPTIQEELEKNGSYTLQLDGTDVLVEATDVEIFSEDIPGWLVANEGKLTVALEVTVTEELRREGVARELVNRIQNIRKSSGFEITDKIKVALSKNPQTDDAVNEYNTYICNQVLANSLELVDEVKNGTELNFDDFSLYVSVVKE